MLFFFILVIHWLSDNCPSTNRRAWDCLLKAFFHLPAWTLPSRRGTEKSALPRANPAVSCGLGWRWCVSVGSSGVTNVPLCGGGGGCWELGRLGEDVQNQGRMLTFCEILVSTGNCSFRSVYKVKHSWNFLFFIRGKKIKTFKFSATAYCYVFLPWMLLFTSHFSK